MEFGFEQPMMRPKPALLLIFTVLIGMAMIAPDHVEARKRRKTKKSKFRRTILSTTINTKRLGDRVMLQHKKKQDLCLSEKDMKLAGVTQIPPEALMLRRKKRYVCLGGLKGSTFKIDYNTLSVNITVPATVFKSQRLPRKRVHDAPIEAKSAVGAFANYDFYGEHQSEKWFYGANLRFNLFSPVGTLQTETLARSIDGEKETIRLSTTLQQDDPELMQTIRIGDMVSASGAWGSSLRLGGFQIARNFGTRPDLVTFPTMPIYSDAVLPSTVDVYINNVMALSDQVRPGPFEVWDLPLVSGDGTVKVVVTDLMGREKVLVAPYYASKQLLKSGMDSFSFETGFMREGYGSSSFEYSDLVVSATYRLGMTDELTAEVHGAAQQDDGGHFGISATHLFDQIGIIEATGAVSHTGNRSGWLYQVGFDRSARGYNLKAAHMQAAHGFFQPGTTSGPTVRRNLFQAGAHLDGLGSLSSSYVDQEQYQLGVSRIYSIGYTTTLFKRLFTSLSLTATDKPKELYAASLSLSIPIGDTTLSTQGSSDSNHVFSSQVSLKKNLPSDEGYGYQANVIRQIDGAYQGEADFQYQTATGLYSAGFLKTEQSTGYRVGALGSAILLDGGLYLKRSVVGSFGITRIEGAEGVTVLANNRPIGKTDSNGVVLLPNLLPYHENKITIDASELPLKADPVVTERIVVPFDRSGVVTEFPIDWISPVLLRIVDSDGSVIPAGTRFDISTSDEPGIVGRKGLAFIQKIAAGTHVISLNAPSGPCEFELTVTKAHQKQNMPRLGTFTCHQGNHP